MKRLLIFCIASVLSANVSLDSTADSAISVDSRIDSANTDLELMRFPPPQKRLSQSRAI